MKEGKRIIYHVTFDGIFFDILSSAFNRLESYANTYLVLDPRTTVPFTYISNPEQLVIVHNQEELGRYLSRPEIDIVFFHGLWRNYYNCYKYLRQDVITIWFCYGKELYETIPGYPCLIRQRLFKGQSFWFYYKDFIKRFHFVRATIGYVLPFYDVLRRKTNRRKMISRIDYIQTPLRIEYELLSKLSYFKAKPFKMDGRGIEPETERLIFHEKAGDILINHSAAYTNNFMEVFKALKRINLSGRKLIFPIVYGFEPVIQLIKEHAGFNGNETVFIEKKMPLNEYEALMASCTHAIYGTLRQQALGNIFNCFRTGVKVFLFKDSMNYRQFKRDGFVVFAIEDMTIDDLSTPLSKEQAIHNNKLYYSLFGMPQDYLQTQLDRLFE